MIVSDQSSISDLGKSGLLEFVFKHGDKSVRTTGYIDPGFDFADILMPTSMALALGIPEREEDTMRSIPKNIKGYRSYVDNVSVMGSMLCSTNGDVFVYDGAPVIIGYGIVKKLKDNLSYQQGTDQWICQMSERQSPFAPFLAVSNWPFFVGLGALGLIWMVLKKKGKI